MVRTQSLGANGPCGPSIIRSALRFVRGISTWSKPCSVTCGFLIGMDAKPTNPTLTTRSRQRTMARAIDVVLTLNRLRSGVIKAATVASRANVKRMGSNGFKGTLEAAPCWIATYMCLPSKARNTPRQPKGRARECVSSLCAVWSVSFDIFCILFMENAVRYIG